MPRSFDLLSITRSTLRVLIPLNCLLGFGIMGLFATSFIEPAWLIGALGLHRDAPTAQLIAMRLVMLIGLFGVPIGNLVLTRLLAILETLRQGDPFIPDNARRLFQIARAILGLELLDLVVGALCGSVSTPSDPLDLGWRFSWDGWLLVLLLFVLARIFRVGTDMRSELEGTV